jgi:hypothetical protein
MTRPVPIDDGRARARDLGLALVQANFDGELMVLGVLTRNAARFAPVW